MHVLYLYIHIPGSFPGWVAVENPLAHLGDIRDMGSSLGWEDYLEEGMATRIHGILALRTPWTEKPGGLQSIELQWVRYYWSVLAGRHTVIRERQHFGLLWWLSGKKSTCSAGTSGDGGSILGLERSPGGRKGNPLQYSCLGNPMDRGAWGGYGPRGCKELDTTEVT